MTETNCWILRSKRSKIKLTARLNKCSRCGIFSPVSRMHGHILVKLHNYSLLGYDDILKVMGIKVKVTAVAAEAYQLPC